MARRIKKKRSKKKRVKKRKKPVKRRKKKKVRKKKKRIKKRKRPAKKKKKRAKKKKAKRKAKRRPVRKKTKPEKIDSFGFEPGETLAIKYEVVELIGKGYEAEVYLIREKETGIERAAKFFFPHRNPNNKVLRFYAKKLHKLRHCDIFIHYHTMESLYFKGMEIAFLVSEFVEGEGLNDFMKRQPGGRVGAFQALHLLHALASGMEPVHAAREYHGDLHGGNIIVGRFGLGFDLKVFDPFQWWGSRPENIQDDVCDMIRIFYDILGGAKHYPNHPKEIRDLCCGLKRSLILKRFRTAGQLKDYLETMKWTSPERR